MSSHYDFSNRIAEKNECTAFVDTNILLDFYGDCVIERLILAALVFLTLLLALMGCLSYNSRF